MTPRGVMSRIGGALAAMVFVVVAIAGAWFWVWWLPNALASWIGGSSWLWFFVVMIVGLPAFDVLMGVVALIIALPAVGFQEALNRVAKSLSPHGLSQVYNHHILAPFPS